MNALVLIYTIIIVVTGIELGSATEIRLTGGDTAASGRVEVLHGGAWGTICSDFWEHVDAVVVCRQLGYRFGTAFWFTGLSPGLGPIWLDDVACEGNEETVQDCSHQGWGIHNCAHDHTQDAAVSCTNAVTEIRLSGGIGNHSGILQVAYKGNWGSICRKGFDNTDAGVACRQMGYKTGIIESVAMAIPESDSVAMVMSDFMCYGTETQLVECLHTDLNDTTQPLCEPHQPVQLTCNHQGVGVRLSGGPQPGSGRVELRVSDQGDWYGICSNWWGWAEAKVLCRELGYAGGSAHAWTQTATSDAVLYQVLMSWVTCKGSEHFISECHTGPLSQHSCDLEYGLAGVICYHGEDNKGRDSFNLRLVNGSGPESGRLEVLHSGIWGTVCDTGWRDRDATLVCQYLGYSSGLARQGAAYGAGRGPIWLSMGGCQQGDKTFLDCQPKLWGNADCQHYEDAAVICYNTAIPEITLRLVNGSGDSGRVEISVAGTWGTICDDGWDEADATVVCRQLGFSQGRPELQAYFGQGSGIIWQWGVNCLGSEHLLSDCPLSEWGGHSDYCSHQEDAGVHCFNEVQTETFSQELEESVRLVGLDGMASPGAGRVEVYHQGQWGTVCDDFWDNKAASVACRQMGYASGGVATLGGAYSQGNGPIWLDNVRCNGTEHSIAECQHDLWSVHNCDHSEDAGVICCGREVDTAEATVAMVGDSNTSGVVQVLHANSWGYICSDDWEDKDATVVCKQLGFHQGEAISATEVISDPNAMFWMDRVQCKGCEISIKECSHRGWGKHDCDVAQLAAVSCHINGPSGESANSGTLNILLLSLVCVFGLTSCVCLWLCCYFKRKMYSSINIFQG